MSDNTAKQCLAICPLFEAELLLQLMLTHWRHPFADVESFRQDLLESATELLTRASDESCTEIFIEGLPTQELNFVAAVWYSEWCSVNDDENERKPREVWLNSIRKALPSCFCSTGFL